MKTIGETQGFQGEAGPQARNSCGEDCSHSRDYRHGEGGGGERPARAVPRNKTGVDWLELMYASCGLAGACPEGLAWQHLNCGLSREP